jgi:hypothetical protein
VQLVKARPLAKKFQSEESQPVFITPASFGEESRRHGLQTML